MADPDTEQMEVASPCNQICTLNAADVCIGCGRSRMEVAVWAQASQLQKRQIVDAAAKRLAALTDATTRTSA